MFVGLSSILPPHTCKGPWHWSKPVQSRRWRIQIICASSSGSWKKSCFDAHWTGVSHQIVVSRSSFVVAHPILLSSHKLHTPTHTDFRAHTKLGFERDALCLSAGCRKHLKQTKFSFVLVRVGLYYPAWSCSHP